MAHAEQVQALQKGALMSLAVFASEAQPPELHEPSSSQAVSERGSQQPRVTQRSCREL